MREMVMKNVIRAFASLTVVGLAAPALAQEPEHNAEAETEAVESGEATPTVENSTTQPELLNRIELLPASAFPAPKTRGIANGSLAGTFHGLQWPYMPYSGIGFSGSAWVDSGYETIKRGNDTEQNINYWLQQGRVLLRVTPTYSDGDFFVQGQAELVANKDQSLRQPDVADTDDLWIRFGTWKKWDVQLGRFEGWEVYHFGMGLDLNTLERQGATSTTYSAPEIYGLTYAFYRPAGVGQLAAHLYPVDWLRMSSARSSATSSARTPSPPGRSRWSTSARSRSSSAPSGSRAPTRTRMPRARSPAAAPAGRSSTSSVTVSRWASAARPAWSTATRRTAPTTRRAPTPPTRPACSPTCSSSRTW
jgi:hypothetical protein